jgi:lipopolysaccharide transport system permease protein
MAIWYDKLRRPIIYYWDLLYELVRRDLKVQYEGTFLGFAWTLLIPILHLGIFYFLFKVILEVKNPRFTSFAFIGIISYGWFQSALSQAAGSISGSNRDLALRPGFPIPLLPFIAVSSSMLHFIFTFPLIVFIVMAEDHHLSAAIFLIPLIMAIQFVLCLGFGYLLAILNIVFRDTKHILDAVLRLFYFISPVFYDPQMVPEKYRQFYVLNPMVTILQSYRDIILHGIMPDWFSLGILATFATVVTWIGFRIFQKQIYRFLDEL